MNKSNNEKRPGLKVFEKFTPEGENLRPGYAYLIRSSVRMPELYPLLGELLFASRVVKDNEDGVPPNVIGMFIEDSPDNLIQHLKGPDFYTSIKDITGNFGNALANGEENDEPPRMAAWLDTFGSFHDASRNLNAKEFKFDNGKPDGKYKTQDGKIKEEYKWWSKSIAGPGNPMAIMRFFRLVQEKPGGAGLNVFLLNSLSNLYRNLELSESAAFLKTMLNESIWSVEPKSDKQDVRYKSGLFFAVLQESVLNEQETSYLESFFDGIIKVGPCVLENEFRVARVHIEVLPEFVQSHNDFVYIPMWQYDRNNNKFRPGWNKKHLKYICTHKADNCIDLEKPNDEANKKIPR